ncbi:MAG TPA: hypothetical protein VJY35_14490 [Candidatus Eisenbacteria bacterium]|nr:hypothetical protein [Candidatus Eisenbacteria bacterium]
MRARAFFYVCAGVFLLACSYHLGARNVRAAGGHTVTLGAYDWDANPIAVDEGGSLWVLDSGTAHGPFQLPGTGTPVAVNGYWSNGHLFGSVLYADGSAFYRDGDNWYPRGNVFGGPTPAMRQTWGATKARYR